jgi:hypothetical protein
MSVNHKTITVVHGGAVTYMIDAGIRLYFAVSLRGSFLENMLGLPGACAELIFNVCLSVCFSAWNNPAPTVEEMQVSLQSDKNN